MTSKLKFCVLLAIGLGLSASTFAAPILAKVIKVKGDVFYGGVRLKEGGIISKPGRIKTGKKSLAKIRLDTIKSTITVGSNSDFKISSLKSLKKVQFSLMGGLVRWVSSKTRLKKTGNQFITTKNVSFGVRGTDFAIIRNNLLGETEIVVADGKVLMSSLTHKKDRKLVGKNQWGGLGGRFGDRIGKILDLDQSVVGAILAPLK